MLLGQYLLLLSGRGRTDYAIGTYRVCILHFVVCKSLCCCNHLLQQTVARLSTRHLHSGCLKLLLCIFQLPFQPVAE